jgi:transposase-like protein
MMAMIEVKCPKCGSKKVIKYGKSHEGKQRYKCKKWSYTGVNFWETKR